MVLNLWREDISSPLGTSPGLHAGVNQRSSNVLQTLLGIIVLWQDSFNELPQQSVIACTFKFAPL